MRRAILSSRLERSRANSAALQWTQRQQTLVKEFSRRVQSQEYEFTAEDCPCGSGDDVLVAQIDRYGLPLDTALCLNCGTLRFPSYLDKRSLSDFYQNMYQEMYARAPNLHEYFPNQQGYGRRILAHYKKQLPSKASILEIGCGAGGGLSAFQEQGHIVAGCELSQELIAFGQSRGVDNLWVGTVGEMPAQLQFVKWDLIYLHHVFEHVQSPAETLLELGKLLAPQGRILVVVPDITRVDRFPNPAGDILRFLHVAHKFNYTPECLTRIAERLDISSSVQEPPAELETVWSNMPELWMEFSAGPATARPSKPERTGERVLEYLQKTEALFQAGQYTAQRSATTRGSQTPKSTYLPKERDMSQTPVRVFIGSGEASVLERKTLIYSLQKHSQRPLDIYVFNGTHNSIEHNQDKPVLANMPLHIKYYNFTEFSLYRFLIPEICNHQGRAIFLDSDVACLGDIGELFDLPMNGADMLCVKAYGTAEWGPSVLLLDCSKCRFDLPRIFDEIGSGQFSYGDFTRLGEPYLAVHPHAIGELDPGWNSFDKIGEGTKIVHYTSLMTQPWRYVGHPHGETWFQLFWEAQAAGQITESEITKAIWRGYARPNIQEGNNPVPPAAASSTPPVIESAGRGPRRPHWLKRVTRRLLGRTR